MTASKPLDPTASLAGLSAGQASPYLSRSELLRYSRHLLLPGVTLEGQKRLKGARVLCVGAGALGAPLGLYLAAAGVGRLGLVDFDTVELSNLQRQILYSSSDVGRPKVEAARERLLGLNPEVEVVTHAEKLTSENALELIGQYDLVADGSDNFPTRYLVNDACVLLGKPLVHGSIYQFAGQVSVFDARRGPCYRCLFPQPPPPELVPSCADGGVLGVLPGIIGSLQALEVLKLILGLGEPLLGRVVLFDALAFSFKELALRRDPHCAVCGPAPTVTALMDYEDFCGHGGGLGGSRVGGAATISVEEFDGRRRAGEAFELLDVREPFEQELAQIPGAVCLPLSELQARLHELDSARSFVLYCRRSGRSLQAYQLLHSAGFGRVLILAGGMEAWARLMDPPSPRPGLPG
jgi:molybdopterin/thiamine biosynthesis adenylyltransferase/rhodanese-related sulfurtransferase